MGVAGRLRVVSGVTIRLVVGSQITRGMLHGLVVWLHKGKNIVRSLMQAQLRTTMITKDLADQESWLRRPRQTLGAVAKTGRGIHQTRPLLHSNPHTVEAHLHLPSEGAYHPIQEDYWKFKINTRNSHGKVLVMEQVSADHNPRAA